MAAFLGEHCHVLWTVLVESLATGEEGTPESSSFPYHGTRVSHCECTAGHTICFRRNFNIRRA